VSVVGVDENIEEILSDAMRGTKKKKFVRLHFSLLFSKEKTKRALFEKHI